MTVRPTGDRYDNDAHYRGGSVLAVEMHARAAGTLVRHPGFPVGQMRQSAPFALNGVVYTADGEVIFHRTWRKRIPSTVD